LLHFQHHIEVPIKCVHGSLYARVSCHIYNELEDYARLAAAVQQIVAAEAEGS
jgi:isopenicillin-N epimerase